MPTKGTWGNAPRNIARAPGLWQIDPALSKRSSLTERLGLNFRAEAFNVFNHVEYETPPAVWGATGFGVITNSFDKFNSHRKYGDLVRLSRVSNVGVYCTGPWSEVAFSGRYIAPRPESCLRSGGLPTTLSSRK